MRNKRQGVKGMTPAQEAARLENLEKAKAKRESEACADIPDYIPPDSGVVPIVADMQHVYRNSDRHDKTAGQKFQRKFQRSNPSAFTKQLFEFEGKILHKSEEVSKDEGSEKAIALCKKLLANFEAKEIKENVEFATKPNAVQIGATLQHQLAAALDRENRLRERLKVLEQAAAATAGV